MFEVGQLWRNLRTLALVRVDLVKDMDVWWTDTVTGQRGCSDAFDFVVWQNFVRVE